MTTTMMTTATTMTKEMTTETETETTELEPQRRSPAGRRPWRGARVRILAWVIGLLAASTLATLVLERQVLTGRVEERVDDSLEQEVEEFRRLVRDGRNPLTGRPFGNDVAAIFDVFLTRNVPNEHEAYYTFLRGRPYRSTQPDADADVITEVRELRGTEGVERGGFTGPQGEIRYLAVPVRVDGAPRGLFVVTDRLGEEEDDVNDVLRVNAIVALSVLLVASALAFLAVGRVLAPLRDVVDTARSISETDLTRRIIVEGDDEIADLARTFNEMVDRLEAAFSTQRAFLSDAGHELRTPITIIQGHLDLLASGAANKEDVLPVVTDELDRMSRLVEDLLLLARARRPNFLYLRHEDLDELTEELFGKASPVADRHWQLEGVGVGRLLIDRQRMTQAVMNLLRNAVEHTEPGGRIALGSEIGGGMARIWVSDSGPGVPASEREHIFERFARGPDAHARRKEGAGLGLAIARAVAEAHGGRILLDESREGEGATFAIVVPTREEQS
jgi:signal transduction histidine kinase